MKRRRIMYFLLLFFGIASIFVTLFLITLMPDEVPMHYNMSGQVDRYGSKFENLFLSIFPIAISLLFFFLAKSEKKRGNSKNERVLLIAGNGVELLLLCFIILDMSKSTSQAMNESTLVKGLSMLMGLVFCFMAFLLPQAERNSVFGIRTRWSLSDDLVWAESQKKSSFVFAISGLLLVIFSYVLKGFFCVVCIFAVSILACAIVTIITYAVWRKNKK